MTVYDIITYKDPVPNNHILHTLLVKLSCQLFGRHQVPARIPNLLGFLLYLYATIRFSYLISACWAIQAFVASALLLNIFLLDFFSIARGYGLSIDLLLLSCWLGYCWLSAGRRRDLLVALLTAVLAVYANFTVLNFFAPFIILLATFILLRSGTLGARLWSLSGIACAVALLAAISYVPITKMQATNQFVYWGTTGFYKETLSSVTQMSLGDSKINLTVANSVIILAIVCMMAACMVNLFSKKRNLLRPANFFLALLIGAMGTTIAQYYLIGTPYLSMHTAIWYYPLFVLAVSFYGALLADLHPPIGKTIAASGAAFALYSFCTDANLRATKEWWFDKNTPR
jgi:hypothetical protein